MKSLFLRCLVVAIFLIEFSCEKPSPNVELDLIHSLAQAAVSSEQFKNLDLDLANFNLSDAHFVTSDQNSIGIPANNSAGRSGLVAIFNDDQSLKKIMFFDVKVYSQTTDIHSDLKSGKFDGTFLFKFEEGAVNLEVEKSLVIQTKIDKTRFAEKCAYWASEGGGGAFDCAGGRISNLNWWDKALCYAGFMECLAQNVISCAIDGCTQ